MTDSTFDAKTYVRSLTSSPGVYRMLNEAGDVLYVGKARNLKKRVSSYFLRASGDAKTEAMLDQVADIEVSVTHTEDEALLLESTLIKKYRPRYNVYLRDDKSYPYLHITGGHDFPRVTFHRGSRKAPGHYFGPYPSAGAVRQTQNTVCKLFKLRNCSDSFFENRSRPCLQYQIKRCTAPCVGFIDQQTYARDVADAVDMLEGRNEKLVNRLVREMETAADKLEFEYAARLREKIAAVRRLQEQRHSLGKTGDFDIIAGGMAGGQAGVVAVNVRGGVNLGHRSFFPAMPRGTHEADLMAAFVGQYYLERKPPGELLVDPAPAEREWLEASLGERAGRRVLIKTRVRGQRAHWLKNARATLAQSLDARLASRAGVEARLNALQQALDLPAPPMRMECFDISHTGGERTVASCVVFQAGAPDKAAYRRFNIDGIEPGDDYAALAQAVSRRIKRLIGGEQGLPDLLLIDGGLGQLRTVEKVLEDMQTPPLNLLSIAKGMARKPGQEQLFLPGRRSPLILPPDSPALHLIQQIRDEAHRFAVAGHRGRRQKARRYSTLEDIEGLGPTRRKRLLKAFGGTRQVARAGVSDLAQVEGISTDMAERIYQHLHG